MADLRGNEIKDSYQNVVTRGTGNKLDDGNGVEFADLDDKASLSGTAIQTISLTKTNTYSETTTDRGDYTGNIPDFILNITPRSTSSKILVFGRVSIGADTPTLLRMVRNGSPIALADSAGTRTLGHSPGAYTSSNRMINTDFAFLDSPGTNLEVSYGVQLTTYVGSGSTLYVNRSFDDTDAGARGRGVSTITAMEIG